MSFYSIIPLFFEHCVLIHSLDVDHMCVNLILAHICYTLLAFLTLNRIWIPQVHRITAVALHLGVFQGIVYFLREALWVKSIEESNDKLY